ncbi:DUF2752 domain-containing protein [Leptospira andrefontaineae]|uniref:DUF2752 domain-containing protein n=1 Tax=Leptospira andrefontaineae TaxID=2484976 RepID=A0A4R9H321_9LEPT|nr:DUF2752 domain-containing protein [Leptospira andrefontaineae]TGK39129.1 DUF2752 domain-containing protein [Leptospira andrefontaineae]
MWDQLRNQLKGFLILEAGPTGGPVSNPIFRLLFTISLSLIVFLVLAILISFQLPLETESEHWFTICWWKQLTGWDCPGCGLTRSVICFFRGDFSGSWNYHPFGIPIAILGTSGFIIRWNLGKQVWRKILENRFTEVFAYLGVISIFVWYYIKHFY